MYLLTFPLDLCKFIKQNKIKETKPEGSTAVRHPSDVPSDGIPIISNSFFLLFLISTYQFPKELI